MANPHCMFTLGSWSCGSVLACLASMAPSGSWRNMEQFPCYPFTSMSCLGLLSMPSFHFFSRVFSLCSSPTDVLCLPPWWPWSRVWEWRGD